MGPVAEDGLSGGSGALALQLKSRYFSCTDSGKVRAKVKGRLQAEILLLDCF